MAEFGGARGERRHHFGFHEPRQNLLTPCFGAIRWVLVVSGVPRWSRQPSFPERTGVTNGVPAHGRRWSAISISPAQRPNRRRGEKQIPMCSLQPWTCSQVQALPRQSMVGPSSDSRLWLGETPVEASSAVNGRACRWRKPSAGTGQPLQPTCRPQHDEKTAAPKMLPSLKLVRRVSWDSRTVIGTVKALMAEG